MFVPTVKYGVPEGIESFANRVLSMHGPENSQYPELDNEFLVVNTPNMPQTFFVKHGPATVLWTIVDTGEIPEEYMKYITYEEDGTLAAVSQILLGTLAQKKRFMDTEDLNIRDYIAFPECRIEEVD